VNDFATSHPELSSEVIAGDPRTVSAGSDQKMTWECKLGHRWVASVGSRAIRNTGCPTCAGQTILPGFNDLLTLFPEIASQADGWDPTNTSPGSHEYFSWKCNKGHKWKSKVQSRVNHLTKRKKDSEASGCPYCHGRKVWEGFNDLMTTHPELAKLLADPNDALKVTFGSETRLNWMCEKGHEYQSRVFDMQKPGKHCPFCSGAKVLEGFNDLATTHPFYANQLTNLNPKEVSAGSKKVGQWRCSKGHTWNSSINTRISNSVVCPYCSGARVLAGFNDLATTHPELLSEIENWDPRTVTRGSARKLEWKCKFGHTWKAKVTDRTSHKSWCPSCAVSGFDPKLNSWLYFLSHPKWNTFQIGITNFPQQRLKSHAKLGWELLELRGPMDGHLTQQWETAILRMLKAKGADLSNPKIAGKFDGYSEAWSKSTFEAKSIKELMRLTEEFEKK
jgi:hypothetical protein